MDNRQKQIVLDVVDNEGFEYAFVDYSKFNDIKDDEFHKARKRYLKAREKLAEIIDYKY